MNTDQVGGLVRAIVAAVGGYFVGKGFLDASTVTMISGVAVTVATAVWSWYTNKPGTVIPVK